MKVIRVGTISASRSTKIADLVDGMEDRLVAECEAKGIAGNSSERKQVEGVEPDDQAPE